MNCIPVFQSTTDPHLGPHCQANVPDEPSSIFSNLDEFHIISRFVDPLRIYFSISPAGNVAKFPFVAFCTVKICCSEKASYIIHVFVWQLHKYGITPCCQLFVSKLFSLIILTRYLENLNYRHTRLLYCA
jgi:hypothetical protein